MADAATLFKLSETTSFTPDEINALHANFSKMVKSGSAGVNPQQFQELLGFTGGTLFMEGLIRMFNLNKSTNFLEFATSLAIYHNKVKNMPDAANEKQRLFFKIYDADGDGEISQDDLKKILAACFESNYMEVAAKDIDELVKGTFENYEKTPSGKISLASFCKRAFSHRSGYM